MDVADVVDWIKVSPGPVASCEECAALWKESAEYYGIVYRAPSDGMALMLLVESFKRYVKHRNTHETVGVEESM